MKKLICIVAVLTLAAPLFAANPDPNEIVVFSGNTATSGALALSYQIEDVTNPGVAKTVDTTPPVGLGLKVEVISGDAKINSVSGLSTAFKVYPDYLNYLTGQTGDPNANDYYIGMGDPMADPAGPGWLDISGGVTTASICMGRLEDGVQGPNPGPNADALLTLGFTGTTASQVKVSLDTKRGGVVGETAALRTNLPQIFTVTFGPACWNNSCQPFGDANGDGYIDASDVQLLIAAWSGAYNPCVDFNHDGFIDASDVQIILAHWATGCP